MQEVVLKRLTTIERLLRRMQKGPGDGSTTCDSVHVVKEDDPRYTVSTYIIPWSAYIHTPTSVFVYYANRYILVLFTVQWYTLLTVVAEDAVAYGRRLLDIMFSKAEQKVSLVHKTHAKSSYKAAADRGHFHSRIKTYHLMVR